MVSPRRSRRGLHRRVAAAVEDERGVAPEEARRVRAQGERLGDAELGDEALGVGFFVVVLHRVMSLAKDYYIKTCLVCRRLATSRASVGRVLRTLEVLGLNLSASEAREARPPSSAAADIDAVVRRAKKTRP